MLGNMVRVLEVTRNCWVALVLCRQGETRKKERKWVMHVLICFVFLFTVCREGTKERKK
jgi:hypothetical protein